MLDRSDLVNICRESIWSSIPKGTLLEMITQDDVLTIRPW